jgi:hypothetical protein
VLKQGVASGVTSKRGSRLRQRTSGRPYFVRHRD